MEDNSADDSANSKEFSVEESTEQSVRHTWFHWDYSFLDENFYQMRRYHHPELPLNRTLSQRIFLWFAQFTIILMGYYLLSETAGGLVHLLTFLQYPTELESMSLIFFGSLFFLFLFSKLFQPTAVLCGAVLGEIALESHTAIGLQWAIIGYVAWGVFWESRLSYKGGEFYHGARILHQFGLSIMQIGCYLIILYFSITFTPLGSPIFTDSDARYFFLIYFFTCNFFWVIPLVLVLWLLDRGLVPYFPLTAEEEQKLNEHPLSEEEKEIEKFFPQPGEYYNEMLTHHPIEADNHTIVLMLGKVRIYFCTRCSSMILGVFYSLFINQILSDLFNFTFPPLIAIWLMGILPLIPLTDWGLQALKLRPANTTSRLISGLDSWLFYYLDSICKILFRNRNHLNCGLFWFFFCFRNA